MGFIQVGISGPDITHMLFVDDVMLFAKATPDNIQNVLGIVELFCQRSGQRINVDKSPVFCSPGIHGRWQIFYSELISLKGVWELHLSKIPPR